MRAIELMRLTDIKPAQRNSKTHDIELIATSVDRYGFADAPILDERTGRLVAGHGRIAALNERKSSGASPPDGVQLDSSGDWLVPVQRGWASRSDADAEAFLIGHNRATELGGWDQEILDAMLLDAAKGGPDGLRGTGFVEKDIERIINEARAPVVEDAPVEGDENSGIMPGDVFELGAHRLICGDSTNEEHIKALFGEERASLFHTDPPYGVAYDNSNRGDGRKAKPTVAHDELKGDKLQAFLEKTFEVAKTFALKPDAAWYMWHAGLTSATFVAAMNSSSIKIAAQIIWVKPWMVLGRGQYQWRHEPCWFGWVEGNQPPDFGERNQTTVWEIDPISNAERAELNHATPKPVKLFELPITKHTKTGEIVFEAFAGSGPQFIAAEQLGRRCFGVEFEPKHVSAIIKRWEKYTGREAEKVS